jgi:putative membrane protein
MYLAVFSLHKMLQIKQLIITINRRLPMEEILNMKYVISALVFSGIGVLVFVITFTVLDLLTPRISIWKELVDKQNVAVAIFLGAMAIGISTIIASAIHG